MLLIHDDIRCEGFSQLGVNFSHYFIPIQIGLKKLIFCFDNIITGINFKELANVVDFVVLSYSFFRNLCTPDLKNGVFPITGNYDKTLVQKLFSQMSTQCY